MKQILIDYMKQFSDLSEAELEKVASEVDVASFPKGTVLLHQGEVPDRCFFILKGCIRKYTVDETGKETTFNFYTEEESVTIFSNGKESNYSLNCLEDCVLVVGDLSTEQESYDANPALEAMTRKMIEGSMGQMHDEFAAYMSQAPEERFKTLMEKRPGLIDRVPNYQLASYLGITPESFSRIKKRLGSPQP
ncbi:Crp/Fnr family transcriptional regulator [Halobacillus locisalis]|uniref:Crp/Fnr family transcriptional regulator n=1 Tax=Halobacillus locisalis TaxID=220753 RepID=A0A838CVR6_9BACI|nr:Crp/Fnr family transcriptional regulator [Halobacillus locisalis]MBA2176028.1 Crp/Fnr family transcriptional regulator [Halobacillus locisalis]